MTTVRAGKAALYSDPDKKPAVPPPAWDAIPNALRTAARWVLWRLVWRANADGAGRWDKVPFQSTGAVAKSNGSGTWTTFDTASAAFDPAAFDGVGFVLGGGFAGVDLDNVIDPTTGEWFPWAERIVRRFATYTELSPSGTGVKLFGHGLWTGDRHRWRVETGEVEVYSAARYFTITGARVGGVTTVENVQVALDELAGEVPGSGDGAATCGNPARRGGAAPPDDELIRKAMAARNGDKLRRLWAGDTSGHGGDDSAADLALCGLLAFWTGPDPARIDALFRQSGLMRPKWDRKRGATTYGERTIATALNGRTEFHTPRPPPPTAAASGPPTGAAVVPEYRPPPSPRPPEWPAPPGEEAYHGRMGDIVRTLEPETEADPVALLIQALVMFGNAVGRHAHFRVEGTRHFTNLFAALVGTTSGGRKGTSHGRVKPLFTALDDDWLTGRNVGGISSAEGLLFQVRDANERDEDPGADDKRLMLTEPEFANVLKQTERQGNTVSVYLRQLWDGLDVVQTLTKNAPVKATAAHVSMIGHITPEELHRGLTATETANGFANRFPFACVRRSKLLPDGGTLNPRALPPLTAALEAAAGFAQAGGEVTRHPSARPLWHAVYPLLTADRPGLAGAMTARAAPHTLRLALLYALLDRSPVILPCHLMAGLAVWDYCDRSVAFLFGDRTGHPLADELRELLRTAPGGLTRSELNRAMGNHAHGDRLTTALTALRSLGLARCETVRTDGRSAERWHATHRPGRESQLMATARAALAECVGSVESPPGSPARPFQRLSRFPRTAADTPAGILSSPSPPPPPPPPTPAEVWLVNVLRNGPRAKADIDKAAKAAGVSRVNALGTVLRVVITEGRAGCWFWRLPDGFDLSRYPAPPEPPPPTLLDDLAGDPPAALETGRKGKRRKAKGNAALPKSDRPESEASVGGPPTADELATLLRKAKRPWPEVADCLESHGEYFDRALGVHGLTGPQLALAAALLAGEGVPATPQDAPV